MAAFASRICDLVKNKCMLIHGYLFMTFIAGHTNMFSFNPERGLIVIEGCDFPLVGAMAPQTIGGAILAELPEMNIGVTVCAAC